MELNQIIVQASKSSGSLAYYFSANRHMLYKSYSQSIYFSVDFTLLVNTKIFYGFLTSYSSDNNIYEYTLMSCSQLIINVWWIMHTNKFLILQDSNCYLLNFWLSDPPRLYSKPPGYDLCLWSMLKVTRYIRYLISYLT